MFNNFFKNKRILLTGHTGFKGSWLALWLHELGAKVTGLALPTSTEPSHFDLIGLKDLIDHLEGDVRDLKAVKKAFEQAKPEIIFHLAAQALVGVSYDDPKTTFDTNIGGTVNILEVIRNCPSVKAVVVITSDKCYENREWVWGYRENDPMGGHDPYSASKGAAEIVCSSYLRSFFQQGVNGPYIGFATARAGNVIGGGDWAKDRIIPDCIRSLSKGNPVIIRNPEATRPWQHVLDPLSGYLLLAKKIIENSKRYSGSWNFGPLESNQIKVIELANKFITAWGGTGSIEAPPVEKETPHETFILKLCIDKAVMELHWRPKLTCDDSIQWTVDWYKAWHEGDQDLQSLSRNQIKQFTKITSKKVS